MELLIAVCIILWLWALILLCSRRDIEIHRKLSWVVTLLVLNVIGALIYFIFAPRWSPAPIAPDQAIDPEAKPINPEGRSWNPILGENRFAAGKGLNPKEEQKREED